MTPTEVRWSWQLQPTDVRKDLPGALLPNIEDQELEAAGHSAHWEFPELVNPILIRFLTTRARGPPGTTNEAGWERAGSGSQCVSVLDF